MKILILFLIFSVQVFAQTTPASNWPTTGNTLVEGPSVKVWSDNSGIIVIPIAGTIARVGVLIKNISYGTDISPEVLIGPIKVTAPNTVPAWHYVDINNQPEVNVIFDNDSRKSGVFDVNVQFDSVFIELYEPPPAAPIDTFDVNTVEISWLLNHEPDFSHYNVYVWENGKANQVFTNTDTVFFIQDTISTHYRVEVTALDSLLNESGPAWIEFYLDVPIPTTQPDTTPPNSPAGLMARKATFVLKQQADNNNEKTEER